MTMLLPAAIRRILALLVLGLLALTAAAAPAAALKPIEIGGDAERLDITVLGDIYDARGDTLQIETAVGADGTAGRMSVRAVTPGTNPNWFAFALRNGTEKPIERWLVAERYVHAGSGIIWPDLDTRRVEAVTPSLGFVPERLPFDTADAFRLSIEPGQTVTFVAELAGDRVPRLQLWRGTDFDKRVRDRQLFQGVLLGIVGLLALFLTTVFAANHKAIFPTAALFTWVVLAYLCVDFGFWHKLFNVRPEENAQYRAAGEAAISATLLIFAHTFLRIGRWHGFVRMLVGLLILSQLALVGLAFLDPRLAATFARTSLAGVVGVAALVTLYLALRGQDRALAIVPTWILFGVWLFGAGLVLSGRLSSDVVVHGMIAGLVAIVVLIGFTVTQFAFRAVEPLFAGAVDDQQLRALAIENTGAAVFEWNARRDEVRIGASLSSALGLPAGERRESFARFAERLHPADRERLHHALSATRVRGAGPLRIAFRMLHADGSERWFELDSAGVAGHGADITRCIGLLRDITDERRSQSRLMNDAVHDSLTGLANRSLFLDRLAQALARSSVDPGAHPTLLCVDLDTFKSINDKVGLHVGDSLLVTVARRLQRLAGPLDTVGRVGGDQFAILLAATRDERQQHLFAEDVRAAIKGPIQIGGQELVLTGSIGIASPPTTAARSAEDALADAEVAMYRARREGPDRIERYLASMRRDKDQRLTIEQELREAIDKRLLRLVFSPIMYLRTGELAGFEAQVRWQHRQLGLLNPVEFVPLSAASDTVARLGSYMLQAAVVEAQRWQSEYTRPGAPLFVSVNVASRQLLKQELVTEVRHIIDRGVLPRGVLRLEISEAVVMDNPEQASQVVHALAEAGARLTLDEFGAGYSSVSYLGTFPFDTIKVDPALVQLAAMPGASAATLRSVVALVHELGKVVIADGVETDAEVGFLRSIGCEHAQGTLYGDGIGAKEAFALVKSARRSDKRMKRSGLFRLRERRIEDEVAATRTKPPTGNGANDPAHLGQRAKSDGGAAGDVRPTSPGNGPANTAAAHAAGSPPRPRDDGVHTRTIPRPRPPADSRPTAPPMQPATATASAAMAGRVQPAPSIVQPPPSSPVQAPPPSPPMQTARDAATAPLPPDPRQMQRQAASALERLQTLVARAPRTDARAAPASSAAPPPLRVATQMPSGAPPLPPRPERADTPEPARPQTAPPQLAPTPNPATTAAGPAGADAPFSAAASFPPATDGLSRFKADLAASASVAPAPTAGSTAAHTPVDVAQAAQKSDAPSGPRPAQVAAAALPPEIAASLARLAGKSGAQAPTPTPEPPARSRASGQG